MMPHADGKTLALNERLHCYRSTNILLYIDSHRNTATMLAVAANVAVGVYSAVSSATLVHD